MAAASSTSSLEVKSPEDLTVNMHHVSYAFAVLSERVTLTPGRAKPDFKDVRCPEGKDYKVFIIWQKPGLQDEGLQRGTITMAYTPPGTVCRGCPIANAGTLAGAIRKAALHNDPKFPDIMPDELLTLTCKLHILQEIKAVSSPSMLRRSWSPDLHGLGLTAPNPRYDSEEDGSLKRTGAFVLNEVPRTLNWSVETTLSNLLENIGYLSGALGNVDPFTFCGSFPKASRVLILTFRSTANCADWSEVEAWRNAELAREGWQSIVHSDAPVPDLDGVFVMGGGPEDGDTSPAGSGDDFTLIEGSDTERAIFDDESDADGNDDDGQDDHVEDGFVVPSPVLEFRVIRR
jgi:AMMECR1 domain-containing protein